METKNMEEFKARNDKEVILNKVRGIKEKIKKFAVCPAMKNDLE